MPRYSVGGRSVATAATGDNVGAALWNPHATKPIWVRKIEWFKTVGTADNPSLVRISTRGTASLTVTPTATNDWQSASVAPVSGMLLDLTYSAQPTVAGVYLIRNNLIATVGAGLVWDLDKDGGIRVGPGTGLAVATPVAVILQPADVTFYVKE